MRLLFLKVSKFFGVFFFQFNPIPFLKQYSYFTTQSDEFSFIFSIRIFLRMSKMWTITLKDSITVFCLTCEMNSEFLLILHSTSLVGIHWRKCWPQVLYETSFLDFEKWFMESNSKVNTMVKKGQLLNLKASRVDTSSLDVRALKLK